MSITIRPATPADAAECGRIIYAAFASLAAHHRFPCEFPTLEAAMNEASMLTNHPNIHGFIAERDGCILGSNFAEIRSVIAGIGPVSIEPSAQNQGVGRMLMKAAMDRATGSKVAGIRLSTPAYHNRSLCLYTRLGFQAREPLSMMQGPPLNVQFDGYHVRSATAADIIACNTLCGRLHGFDRGREVADSINEGTANVVEHLGKITGYATGVGFFGHAVGETNRELQALIGASKVFSGPGFLVPTRNHEVFNWCLDNGLRLVMQATLLTIGLYNEPTGSYFPSGSY